MIRKSILVVDDEEMLVELGKKILEKQGHEVTMFTYSIDALKVFCKTPYKFDMVITDFNMPHMNGGQLSKKIKEIRNNIPVILVTGCQDITENNLTEWGIDALIDKPYHLEEIIDLVQHLLTPNNTKVL